MGLTNEKALAVLPDFVLWAEPEVELLASLALRSFSPLICGKHVVFFNAVINADVLGPLEGHGMRGVIVVHFHFLLLKQSLMLLHQLFLFLFL